jgi:tetratricopeptide (TPR) repeat protein
VSERTLERCLRLAAYVESNKDLPGRQAMLIDLARVLGAHQHYRDARRLLVDTLGDAPTSPALSRAALIAESELFVQLGEFGAAVELLERAQALGDGDEAEQHRLLSALAQALAGAGDTARALSALDQAARLKMISARSLDCERARIRATILGFAGDWQASAEAASQAVELARGSGLGAEIAQSLHAEGEALLHGTDRPRAYAVLQAALSAADEIGAARLTNLNRMFLAYLDALNGSEQAQKVLGDCMAIAESSKWTYDVLKGRYLLGRLLSERGETEAARRELEMAQRMAETAQALVVVKDCERALSALSSA